MPKKSVPSLLICGLIAGAPCAHAADQLKGEPSAFLKSFADSPVDWMPWGGAAVARAKADGKPVFLFVGSFTSELAGAMRRQTFANAKTAEWLNKQFVCVIVDRDERPDVAALYQAYVNELKQVSGWPLNVWLTPEFQPFEGATYLSPSEDWGAPGYLKLANQVDAAWTTSPAACRRRASEAVAQLAQAARSGPPNWNLDKTRARLASAAAAWRSAFDAERGGFGDVPKAPEPELIRFMLTQSPQDRDEALATLRALATSAVRDPLDGGFFRHSADGAWRIPYQQKTLADQARIALAFLDGAKGADAGSFGQCARGALDYALSRLSLHNGTFASAEDATGDDFVGYYSWTGAEIDAALGADSQAFKLAHGVLPDGNVPAADDPSAQYAKKNLLRSVAEMDASQAAADARLLAARDRRPFPPRDDRATAGAHGLMLSALSRAGAELGDPKYLQAARRTLDAVRANFLVSPSGGLRRLSGSALPAAAEDYAAMALGCRDFARAAKDSEAAALAKLFLGQLDSQFYDPSSGGYFGAPTPPGPGFFMRPAAPDDPPSAGPLALLAGAPHASAVGAALSSSLDESSAQAPGDQLLALAFFAGQAAGK
jgi:uncharacterized protein YyaL (SSP411 family)